MTETRSCGRVIALGLVLVGAGCVSDSNQGLPLAQPLPVRNDIRPDQLSVLAYAPVDIDFDGWPDEYRVEAYLTKRGPEFPDPLAIDGQFKFTIRDQDDRVIQYWEVPPETARIALGTHWKLTVYQLTLEARKPGPDEVFPRSVTLHSEFQATSGGEPVQNTIMLPVGAR